MDKLKNLLKSDTPTEDNTQVSNAGKVAGQGSHFPSTTSPQGTAAIGQTTTYSSSPLPRGDPTSSVVDPASSDPLTYKKPEASQIGNSGVPAGSAVTAAAAALKQDTADQTLPGHENPYRASTLDPRVDGGLKSSEPAITSRSTVPPVASAPVQASTVHSTPTAPAPSSLTTTADPTDRSAEYTKSTETKGLDNTTSLASAKASEPTITSTTETSDPPSIVGRALGAVGLGGLAGSLGCAAAEHEKGSAVEDTPSQPTTTTGVDSYIAPTESKGHYRRESIPTTAYPSGIDSPRPINAPVGGTRSSIDSGNTKAATTGTANITPFHNQITTGDEAPLVEGGLRDSSVVGHGIINPQATAATGVSSAGHDIGNLTSTTLPASQTVPQQSGKFTSAPLADRSVPQESGKFTSAPIAASTVPQESGKFTSAPIAQNDSHKGRDATVVAGAGTAAAAGGFAVAEESKHDYEKLQKEEAKRQAEHQKELEKAEKEHQKEVEKAEKKHQKELEKEHKKEEKQHEKELKQHEKEEHKLQKEREEQERKLHKARQEEEERHRAAAVVPVDEQHEKKEKKPSIFKRIFKRRQNKDTGLEEEYSTDEEDHSHKGAVGAGVVGAGAGVAAYEAHEHEKREAATAGTGTLTKPSYNPLSHDDPNEATATSELPRESITGLPYDPSKDPVRAESLSQHQHGAGVGENTTGNPVTTATATTAAAPVAATHPTSTAITATTATHPTTAASTATAIEPGTSSKPFDPIAAGSFKMGDLVDKQGNPLPAGHDDFGVGTGGGHNLPALSGKGTTGAPLLEEAHQTETTGQHIKDSFKLGGL